MKQKFKKPIKRVIRFIVNLIDQTQLGKYFHDQVLNAAMNRNCKIVHEGIELNLTIPNALSHYRAKTFSTKEPETLQWIDNIPEKSVFWDIGANVGLYSLYAAKKRSCRVWSFEPSVFNLELLARNIFLNKLTHTICIVPIALNEELSENLFRMTTTDWSGALSTFGQNFGQDGESIRSIFEFKTVGLNMMDAVRFLGIPEPDFIKMDVDGIEHLILKGGLALIKKIKGILVEINDNFLEQSTQCQEILSAAGLVRECTQYGSKISALTTKHQNITHNQIWTRAF